MYAHIKVIMPIIIKKYIGIFQLLSQLTRANVWTAGLTAAADGVIESRLFLLLFSRSTRPKHKFLCGNHYHTQTCVFWGFNWTRFPSHYKESLLRDASTKVIFWYITSNYKLLLFFILNHALTLSNKNYN